MCPRRPAPLALPFAVVSPLLLVACAETGEPRVEELKPDANTRYELQDRMGSASVILDQEGAVVAHTGVEPYGETWAEDKQPGEGGAVYRYTDKELDVGVGTIYIGMRHYVPELGRWASPDPKFCWEAPDAIVSDPREGNAYRYGANSPVMQFDPDGRDAVTWELFANWTALWGKVGESGGLAFDDRGRLALIDSDFYGAGSEGVGFEGGGRTGYHFNDNGVTDLAGISHEVGGGGGEGVVLGAAYATSPTNQSAYVSAGAGASAVPVDFYGGQSDTRVTQLGRYPIAGKIFWTVHPAKTNTSIKRHAPTPAPETETPASGPSMDGGYSQEPSAGAEQLSSQPSDCLCSGM